MIKEILFCTLGSIFFAFGMKVPKNCILYVAVGSLITASCEIGLSSYYGELITCCTAMICLVIFCEMIARIKKIPATIILMPSTIPLLPGSSIYYAMLYAITGVNEKFFEYTKSTVLTGLGISLGAVIGSVLIKIIDNRKKRLQ
jgi:uncharacterized membrane protein YjjB (DUF3815 family)